MSDEPIRILIVEARFYDDLADALLEGATQALSAYGAEYDVVTVPGEAFGTPGYARLSYALGDDDIVEGIGRIAKLVADS